MFSFINPSAKNFVCQHLRGVGWPGGPGCSIQLDNAFIASLYAGTHNDLFDPTQTRHSAVRRRPLCLPLLEPTFIVIVPLGRRAQGVGPVAYYINWPHDSTVYSVSNAKRLLASPSGSATGLHLQKSNLTLAHVVNTALERHTWRTGVPCGET